MASRRFSPPSVRRSTMRGHPPSPKRSFGFDDIVAVDYTIEFQMSIRAMKHRLRIVEFPTVEVPRLAGESGAPSLPTGLRFLRCLARELRHRKT